MTFYELQICGTAASSSISWWCGVNYFQNSDAGTSEPLQIYVSHECDNVDNGSEIKFETGVL